MIKASFIIGFQSSRLDNLFQTIRFLERREPNLLKSCEIVLVCQDHSEEISTKFAYTRLLNLGIDKYIRPFILNTGLYHAKGNIVIILDSDRILPYNYFDIAINTLRKGMVISPKHSLKLRTPYSDNSIENNDVEGILELRSDTPSLHTKNVLSGNTIIFKEDYCDAGWMDESFHGYGYSDTDFAMTLCAKGFKFNLTNIVEYHLWHPYSDQYKIQNLLNAVKFCNKWNIPLDNQLSESIIQYGYII